MATVYLAQDLKHRRKVAVKVLRPELAATLGPERFLREIEIAAALNHPHILPLHDSGVAEGFLYYVMPYVEGESLRQRLTREGALPIPEAARILRDVADALAYAHQHKVVHRDIKPDNIMLSGRHALVTDFGVAKAVSEASGRQNLTTAGVALGTPAYMAPEQAAADPNLDHRVDVYALGCVAYELLTGRPPFEKGSAQQTLAAQVTETAEPIAKHRGTVPAALGQLVMKCLEKQPADRWQKADELVGRLEGFASPSGGVTPTDTSPLPGVAVSPFRRAALVSAVTVGLVLSGWAFWPDAPAIIRLGQSQTLTSDRGIEVDPVLSPDGKFIAYAAGPRLSETRIFVKQITGGKPLAVTEKRPGRQRLPQWSPDGDRLLFLSATDTNTAIEVIPAFGGAPRTVVRSGPIGAMALDIAMSVRSAVWSPAGDSFAFVLGDSIFVGGLESPARRVVTGVVDSHSLAWSPDGRWIVLVRGNSGWVHSQSPNRARSQIRVVRATGGEAVPVTSFDELNMSPVWLRDSRTLLFISNRDGRRDLYQVKLQGSGLPAHRPTRFTTGLDAHSISLSADGRALVYSALRDDANIVAVRMGNGPPLPASSARPITFGTQTIEGVSLSPDNRWLAFDHEERGENSGVYKIPVTGGEAELLLRDPNPTNPGGWSGDGSQIALSLVRDGNRDVYVVSADGSNLQRVTSDAFQQLYASLSPDGRSITFAGGEAGRPVPHTMTLDEEGNWGNQRVLSNDPTPGSAGAPRWSPAGDLIAYTSGGVLKVISPEGTGSHVVFTGYANGVAWDKTGRRLIYRTVDNTLRWSFWMVAVNGGQPRQLVFQDDPSLQSHQRFDTDGETLYFTLSQVHSDIWLVEVLR